MIKIENPTFGTDFELFVKRDSKIETCPIEHGGTKDEPLSIGQNCFRQIDGVAAEYNIPPVTNKKDWMHYIKHCIVQGNNILNPLGYSLVAKTSHLFNEDQLTQDRHITFGCTPSYSAYSKGANCPDAESAGTMRSTGFHVHVGFKVSEDDDFDAITKRFIYCMDKSVGKHFLKYDKDTTRRKVYGQAGEYRSKIVEDDDENIILIIEYRSLGGFCINKADEVFDRTQRAIKIFNSDYVFTEKELKNQQALINHKTQLICV